jgi:hypothetical protein
MIPRTLWSRTISLKNKSIILIASLVLWHGIKCTIFKSLLITTNSESLSCFDPGNPNTKSIEMSTHGYLGTDKGVYKLCGWILDFAFLHVMYLSYMCCTSFFIFGQLKCSCNTSKVLITPKCIINSTSQRPKPHMYYK